MTTTLGREPGTAHEPRHGEPVGTHHGSAPALAAAMRCEWRLVRRDPAWWVTMVVLLGCMTLALASGRARVANRAQAVAAAQRDEARRLDNLAGLLGRIERGQVRPPDAPYRDPRNAIYVGRGQGATVAYLPDTPLALTAIGLSDLYPQVLNVSAGSKDSFLFVDEIENPAHLLVGGFDLAFVVVALYPLLILALAYNILSGEAEQGTLALTAASSAPLATVLAGKLLVRVGGLVMAVVVGLAAWLTAFGGIARDGTGLASLAALTLAIILYGAFWTGLALGVNSLRRDSAFNAVALAMVWVVLLMVAPAGLNALAQVLYPAPARADMILAVREAAIDAERDRDASDARYRAEHPDEPRAKSSLAGPIRDDRTVRTLEATLAADARSDSVLAEQERRVRRQRQLSDRLAFLTPPALLNDAIAELAGNGHTRWDDYIARIGGFHKTWQSFFVERAHRGAALTSADYALFPRFSSTDAPGAWLPASQRRVALTLGWLAAVTVFVWVAASRRLARPV